MIPSNRPSIARKDMNVVLSCMVSEDIGPGEQAQKTARAISRELGYYSGAGFSDIQRCLEAALTLIGIEEGGRVALSPLSPFWYHGVLKACGAVPVYWDIEPDTCLPLWKENAGKGIKAALCHHHLGIPASTEFWHENSIPVIEDITEVVGSIYRRELKEPGGAYAILDMGEDAHFTSGGGGLLFSRTKKEQSELKKYLEGMSPSALLSDMNAAFGSAQWSRLEKFTKKREEILDIYKAALLRSRHRGFIIDEESRFIPTAFPVLLTTGGKETYAYARKKKISCRNPFENSIILRYPEGTEALSGAKQLARRCVAFPLYPTLSNAEIDLISKVLASLP